MLPICLFYILCLATSLVFSEEIIGEGKRCIVKKTGQFGLCINIDHCDYAKNLLNSTQWERPQNCGYFIGAYPLVCCPTPRSEIVCQIFYPRKEPCLTKRIYGGKKSATKEFPHMAALGYGDPNDIKWFCGGSLISEHFVLTAAHCIKTKNFGTVKWIRLGDSDLVSTEDDDNNESQPQDFTAAQTYRHPEYKNNLPYHDIALIKLDRSARFSVFVAPACLHVELPVPYDLKITGWGKIDLLGESSSRLLKADIHYVNHTRCKFRYSNVSKRRLPEGIVNDIQVCAGNSDGQDTCPGDSGGPVQYKIYKFHPHFRVVGITSFGQGCGISNTIAVYTRVSNYIQWIENVVWPNEHFALNKGL